MPTIEKSIAVSAPADDLFAYLSDAGHLPEYFPDITEAEPEGNDHVHVEAKVPGGSTRGGEAWFRVDGDARRLEWGSDSDRGYHGWLEVSEHSGGSEVSLGLTMEHDDIDGSIDRTLGRIKSIAEA
jgi:uncharacterized membrane protein